MVDIIGEILELRCSLAEERPHLLAVAIVLLDIREMVRELLPDPLEALAQLSQALADILEIDCRSHANHRKFDHSTAAWRAHVTYLGTLLRARSAR